MRILFSSLALVLGFAVIASAAPVQIDVNMTGTKEPNATGQLGAGDVDGFANGFIKLDPDADTICWLLDYGNLDGTSFTGFHIHGQATTTQNVGVYRGFPTPTTPLTPPSGHLEGCIGLSTDADISNKIDNILNTGLQNWYVNLHTNVFGGGAVRSQLPEPASMTLLVCGLLGLSIRRKRA